MNIRRFVFIIVWMLVGVPVIMYFIHKEMINSKQKDFNISNNKQMTQLVVKSPYFENGGFIPPQFTCDGQDLFPTLEIGNIPAGAKSLAIYVEDPDAPMPRPFVHLMAVNIPASGSSMIIDQAVLDTNAVLGINDFGNLGWNGPCPPPGHGVHHYWFNVLAFDVALPLETGFDINQFVKVVSDYQTHLMASGQLVGLYQR